MGLRSPRGSPCPQTPRRPATCPHRRSLGRRPCDPVSTGTPGGDTPSRSVSPLRGVALVVVAVIIGVLLLNASDDSSADQDVQTTGSGDNTSSTTPGNGGNSGNSST